MKQDVVTVSLDIEHGLQTYLSHDIHEWFGRFRDCRGHCGQSVDIMKVTRGHERHAGFRLESQILPNNQAK